MARKFNTEGQCSPKSHYMVRLEERMRRIKDQYVDPGSYFVINRGRQYGKTTTLWALRDYLKSQYIVLFVDFQLLGTAKFRNETVFSKGFVRKVIDAFLNIDMEDKEREKLLTPLRAFGTENGDAELEELFVCLSEMCRQSSRPVVLMIDEVDSASNNQVFIDFLAQLRGYYLARNVSSIFHSVILAGVYDIKNLKLKLRPDEAHQYNSPWNIAARFRIEMAFSREQIAGMLTEYEQDRNTGMDVAAVAEEIYSYTSGYPYLVSAICKIMDEDLPEEREYQDAGRAWSREGIGEAVKRMLRERMPLFDSLIRQMDEHPDMKQMLQAILFQGRQMAYNPDAKDIELATMFGYIADRDGSVQIANRIFEMRLYNFFLSEAELTSVIYRMAEQEKRRFIVDGKLDMELVLERFVVHFTDIYGENDWKFIEDYGRKFFLLYLKPIINGAGNYYIEAQTRDAKRTDVIVDYGGMQYVIELKIWHGEEYHRRGERQLLEYLEYYHLDKGYMISFNFNKKKETGVKELYFGHKMIVEVVV